MNKQLFVHKPYKLSSVTTDAR